MSNPEQHKRQCKSMTACVVLIPPLVLLVSACGLLGSYTGLTQQARSIRTPADHRAVAQAYHERARCLRAEAAEHAALAEWWSSRASGISPGTRAGASERAEHCRRLAAGLSAAAAEAEVMAEEHQRLGGGTGATGETVQHE